MDDGLYLDSGSGGSGSSTTSVADEFTRLISVQQAYTVNAGIHWSSVDILSTWDQWY